MNSSSKDISALLRQLESASPFEAVEISAQIRDASRHYTKRRTRNTSDVPAQRSSSAHAASKVGNATFADEVATESAKIDSDLLGRMGGRSSVAESLEVLKLSSETLEEIERAASELSVLSINSATEAVRAGESGRHIALVVDGLRQMSGNVVEVAQVASSALRNGLAALASLGAERAPPVDVSSYARTASSIETDGDKALRAVIESVSAVLGREPRLMELQKDLEIDLGIDSTKHSDLVAALIAEINMSLRTNVQGERERLLHSRTIESMLNIVSSAVVRMRSSRVRAIKEATGNASVEWQDF